MHDVLLFFIKAEDGLELQTQILSGCAFFKNRGVTQVEIAAGIDSGHEYRIMECGRTAKRKKCLTVRSRYQLWILTGIFPGTPYKSG